MQDTAVQSLLYILFFLLVVRFTGSTQTARAIIDNNNINIDIPMKTQAVRTATRRGVYILFGMASAPPSGIISSRNSTPSYADAVVSTILCINIDCLKNSHQKQLNTEKKRFATHRDHSV